MIEVEIFEILHWSILTELQSPEHDQLLVIMFDKVLYIFMSYISVRDKRRKFQSFFSITQSDHRKFKCSAKL